MEALVPVLLVSANVGSIFEDPKELLKIWLKEFLLVIKQCEPKFLALHCQEVGGKNYKESMQHVQNFVRALIASEELRHFGQIRIFLDEDFTNTDVFTALGSLYFVHNSLQDVYIWDFHDRKYVPATGTEIHEGSIELVGIKEKVKFPHEIFPESKGSRKGFMRTRWRIGSSEFDLVNIHLFHDASNIIAMEDYPSRYSKLRQNALGYSLQRLTKDSAEIPFFIFGDFNFRLDTKGIVQKLTKTAVPMYVQSAKNGELEKIVYKDVGNESKVILTLGKKIFEFDHHEETFYGNEKWLHDFDREPKVFDKDLFEFNVSFPPSYPFKEDTCSGATCYERTRCPSWCDRIFLSTSALPLLHITPVGGVCPSSQKQQSSPVVYQLVGENIAMGDHKPVMLFFNIRCFPACQDNQASNRGLPRISVTGATQAQTAPSRLIAVRRPGSPIRLFRETTI